MAAILPRFATRRATTPFASCDDKSRHLRLSDDDRSRDYARDDKAGAHNESKDTRTT
jgi:hypothetical protein